jgi:hypothetical protein
MFCLEHLWFRFEHPVILIFSHSLPVFYMYVLRYFKILYNSSSCQSHYITLEVKKSRSYLKLYLLFKSHHGLHQNIFLFKTFICHCVVSARRSTFATEVESSWVPSLPTSVPWNLVNLKLCNLKFLDTSNFSLDLCPKEEKFVEIYVVILKTSIIHN